MAVELRNYLEEWAPRIEERLGEWLPLGGLVVQDAMRYSVLAGGKRLRPVLAIAAHEVAGGDPEQVLDAACSLELIHTYSLIHDDLPAMDDAELRRGKPTSHVRFDEATAILAGDALLPLAFEILADSAKVFPADRVVAAARDLARAVGVAGMVAGQCLDLSAEGQDVSREHLEEIHRLKTGALLETSLRLGAILGGAGPEMIGALTSYGSAIGLAFQVIDDVLDVESDTVTLGKTTGDLDNEKSTYPRILGLGESRRFADELIGVARNSIAELDGPRIDVLGDLADFVIQRRH